MVVILLAVIAACLLLEAGLTVGAAQAQPLAGADRKVFAIAGQVAPDTHGIYLVDLEHGTICVYHYVPSTQRLKLLAARTFVYDVQLDDYNNEPPMLPQEVRRMVEQQRRLESIPAGSPSSQPVGP